MSRIDKALYYLGIAEAVSKRSSCLAKHWGAVIVKDDVIVSTRLVIQWRSKKS